MSLRRLTIYMLRDVIAFEDALDGDKDFKIAAMAPAYSEHFAFYYKSRNPAEPAWVSFVSPALTDKPDGLLSSSSSGLLLLRAKGQMFALTFGYGRSLLDQSKIHRQFGLRVTLNAVDPAQLRSLDTKTFDDMVLTRTTQASRSSELPTFGVDISRDILRAATGEPRDGTLAKRLSGSDALVINRQVKVSDLREFCADLLTIFNSDVYKEDFEWIDQLAVINDKGLIDRLDAEMVDQLRKHDTSRIHLAAPDPIDPAEIDVFKMSPTRRREFDDLDLDEYLDELGAKTDEISVEQLKRWKVSVRYTRSPDLDSRWSIYQCLVAEQQLDTELFALIEGRWFKVSTSLAEQVDGYLAGLDESSLALPDAEHGEKEPDYVRRVASALPDSVLNVDAKIKRPGGAASGIEFCDLVSAEHELVHIKRKSRSSTLSHLFAQGRISATTLVQDGTYRDGVREIISTTAPAETVNNWLNKVPASNGQVVPNHYTVSYVVVANAKAPGTTWIPFFSKLNLMQTGRELQRMGFKVTITRVGVLDL